VNTKKRAIAVRESLESDEEEVEDLWAMDHIEEILHATYERKTRGPRIEGEGSHPFHINVSVQPINPCATNTPNQTPLFRQPKFRGSPIARSTYTTGATTRGANSCSTSQVSTLHDEGITSVFRMEGHDPTIILPEFRGEETKDLEKHLFICANI
jgi:hypothetical protein